MENICDICGRKNIETANYCGQCGVDLKEEKSVSSYLPKSSKTTKRKKENAKEKADENCKVIKWCEINALMRSNDMTLPNFVLLLLLFTEEKRILGFCNCAICDLGYREYLSTVTNLTENKKTKFSSREIVMKARETDIPAIRFNISEFLERGSKTEKDITIEPKINSLNKDQIPVEIDRSILENVILHVLSSSKGKKLVQSCLSENQ
jgi:hypothetical protein